MALKRLNLHHRVLKVLLQRLRSGAVDVQVLSDDITRTWAAHSHALEAVVLPKLRELHLARVAEVVSECTKQVGGPLAELIIESGAAEVHQPAEHLARCIERVIEIEQELLWPALLKRMSEHDVNLLGADIENAAEIYLSHEFLERIDVPDQPGAVPLRLLASGPR